MDGLGRICLLAVLSMLPLALEVIITRGKSLLRSNAENARVTTAFDVTALLITMFRFSLISASFSDLGLLTPAALLIRTGGVHGELLRMCRPT